MDRWAVDDSGSSIAAARAAAFGGYARSIKPEANRADIEKLLSDNADRTPRKRGIVISVLGGDDFNERFKTGVDRFSSQMAKADTVDFATLSALSGGRGR